MLCYDLGNIKELANRQEMIEKSHRRQLVSEIRKKQALKKQLMSASEVIYSLENCLKVGLFVSFKTLTFYTLKEKEKQIERLNIYSRKQKSLKQSVSTGNISALGSDHFAYKLGSKLNLLRKRKESFHIIEENVGDLCEKCKEQLEEKRENNEEQVESVKKNTSIEEDSNASTKNIETVEISVVKKEEKNEKTTNDEEANEERDEETSSIEEILEGKLSSPGGSLRSNKTMTPQEKVRLWLPMNSETKWDIQKKEMKVNFVLDSQDKEDELKIEEKNSKETDIENDSLNDEPANKENEYFKESFETVVNAPIP